MSLHRVHKWSSVWTIAHREWSEATSSGLFWFGAVALPLFLFVLVPVIGIIVSGSILSGESTTRNVAHSIETNAIDSISTIILQPQVERVVPYAPSSQEIDVIPQVELPSEDDVFFGSNALVPVFMVFLLLQSVAMSLVLLSVIQEKSSKLMEVLLASVKPAQLMDGKILGVLLTVSTVAGIWGGTLFVSVVMFQSIFLGDSNSVLQFLLDDVFLAPTLWNCLLFFIIGTPCVAYAVSCVAALCRTAVEARITSMPISLIMAAPVVYVLFNLYTDSIPLYFAFIPMCTSITMMLSSETLPNVGMYLLIVAWLGIYTLGIRWLAARMYSRYVLAEDNVSGVKKLIGIARPAG